MTEPTPPAPTTEPAPPTPDDHDDKDADKDKKKKKKKKKLELGGRVLARGEATKVDTAPDWIGGSTVDSARAKVDYRTHELHAQLSAEFARKPRLKNAYVQLRLYDGTPKLDVRGGQFKMPFSAIELESRWTLPVADRGLVHQILTHRFQVAGRTVGAMVSAAIKGPWQPRLEAGVFQGQDDAGNALEVAASDRFGQDAVARVTVEPIDGITLGAAGESRVGALIIDVPTIVRRAYATEVDATVDLAAGPGIVRAWAEAMTGTSWISGAITPCQGPRACKAGFVEARAIAAYRVGGRSKRERYVELYGLAATVDPDLDTSGDRIVELTGGVTYGAWDLWRVQLEGEVWRFGNQSPLGIAEFATAPVDSTQLLVQLGARL